jgi:transposase InsO family protein
VKYAVIDEHRSEFSVKALCLAPDVGRSGYYAFKTRPPSLRSREDLAMRQEIVKIHMRHRSTPGIVKTWRLLNGAGIHCGKHRVARLRKLEGIQTIRTRRFRVSKAKQRVQPPAPNLVKRAFTVDAPNKVWVGDMTALRTKEGWLHLAVVLDLFARRVVGWSTDIKQEATLPMAAFDMAVEQRRPEAGIVFHSDQGSVYGSTDYCDLLTEHGALRSMSRKGNCWDNAVAESFFLNLKNETMHRQLFSTRAEALAVVRDYIEVYYNRMRLHQTLGYQTPASFEAQFRVLH